MGRLARFIRFFTGDDENKRPNPTYTLRGTSPLSLLSAIKDKISSLIQYGKCSVSGSEITCNNGILTAVDDELPLGYKRITGIKFDGDTWYETGEALTGDDEVTMTLANTVTTGQNVFGSYNGTSSGTKNFSLFIYGNGSASNSYFRYGEQLLRPKFGTGERTIIFGKNGTDGFATDATATQETFTTPANAYIGMLPNSTSPAYTGSIIGNILVGDRLKYIPCERTADGVVGYYETHTETFLEPSGTGSVTKGEYDTSHETAIATIGTAEEIVVEGGNILNLSQENELWKNGSVYFSLEYSDGSVTMTVDRVAALTVVWNLFTVDESMVGTTIALNKGEQPSLTGLSIKISYSTNGTSWQTYNTDTVTFTQSDIDRIIGFWLYNASGENVSVIRPSVSFGTSSAYVPYSHQTATAVNLYAVDGICDEQDIISGKVTRRIKAEVVNGSIVLSVLSVPVIEYVDPQPLNTEDGTNIISWTAEVSGKKMEVTYSSDVAPDNAIVGVAAVGTAII